MSSTTATAVMDLDTVAAQEVIVETRASLTSQLRVQFPYLATATLEQTVNDTLKTLSVHIDKARPAMAASKKRINFFSLPVELRNRVYELVLPEPVYPRDKEIREGQCAHNGCHQGPCILIDSNIPRLPICKHEVSKPDFRPARVPALLQVRRKMRQETMPMHWKGKIFHVKLNTGDGNGWLKDWLQALGKEQAAVIEGIHLHFNYEGIEEYLYDVNFQKYGKWQHCNRKKHWKRATVEQPFGSYKKVWGKKGVLGGILGVLGLGVPAEKFAIETDGDLWTPENEVGKTRHWFDRYECGKAEALRRKTLEKSPSSIPASKHIDEI